MPTIENLGEVVSTDLLIIGGGLAGLVAAIKAKEYSVDVLLVDKQTIGWSGKAPKVGGGLWVMLPDDDVDRFAEYHVKKYRVLSQRPGTVVFLCPRIVRGN